MLQLRYTKAIVTAVTLLSMVAAVIIDHRWLSPVLYVLAYLCGSIFGLQAGFKSLRQRRINIDLLMMIAALGAALVGEYFEGALLLFLFSLSNLLQDFALEKTRDAIKKLMSMRPDTAEVFREGAYHIVPVEEVYRDDRIRVRPGGRISLDGIVVEGASAVNESAITGESLPAPKQIGDKVLAGTLNINGRLTIAVSRLAADSTLANVIRMVEKAREQKAQTASFLDAAEQHYAKAVILLTAVAIVLPAVAGTFLSDGIVSSHDLYGSGLALCADHRHSHHYLVGHRCRCPARGVVQRRALSGAGCRHSSGGLRQNRYPHFWQSATMPHRDGSAGMVPGHRNSQ